MKKIKNVFLIFIFFLIQSSGCIATTPDMYNVSSAGGSPKFLFLLIGLILVSLVLFLGYKMDTMETKENRKKKFKKIINKEEVENVTKDFFPSKEVLKDNSFTHDEIENNQDKLEENVIKEDSIANNSEDEVIEKIDDEELEDELLEQLLEEDINQQDNNVEETEPRKIENFELDKISKIFNEHINSADEDIEFNIGIKGYDYGEDFDLYDLESTIKDANIKKYTRKKKQNTPSSNVKRYTRKRKQEEKVKPKRYTRKIISDDVFKKIEEEKKDIINEIDNLDSLEFKYINEPELNVEEEKIEEKPKAKRGRKPKAKVEEPEINIEALPKSKRGRKPKAKTETNKTETKKTNTKKTDTKKKEEPKKRGRKPKVLTEEEKLRNAIEMLPKSRRGRKPKSK